MPQSPRLNTNPGRGPAKVGEGEKPGVTNTEGWEPELLLGIARVRTIFHRLRVCASIRGILRSMLFYSIPSGATCLADSARLSPACVR